MSNLDRSTTSPVLAKVREIWDARAGDWDVMSQNNAQAQDRSADLDHIERALRLEPGDRLLDAGCGTGQWAIAFAQRRFEVVGVDLAPSMIARARQRAMEANVSIDWRVGNLAELADPDASFDAVLARASLQFTPNPIEALRELRRVLKPGGRLYSCVPGALSPIYSESWRRFTPEHQGTANFIVPWELEAILQDQGWTVVEGWGTFGPAGNQTQNSFSADDVRDLPPRLRQAASTLWVWIAE